MVLCLLNFTFRRNQKRIIRAKTSGTKISIVRSNTRIKPKLFKLFVIFVCTVYNCRPFRRSDKIITFNIRTYFSSRCFVTNVCWDWLRLTGGPTVHLVDNNNQKIISGSLNFLFFIILRFELKNKQYYYKL